MPIIVKSPDMRAWAARGFLDQDQIRFDANRL